MISMKNEHDKHNERILRAREMRHNPTAAERILWFEIPSTAYHGTIYC
jgi:very-short-patch-repair endonuclease